MEKKYTVDISSELELCNTLTAIITAIEENNLLLAIEKNEDFELVFGQIIDSKFVPYQSKSTPIKYPFGDYDVLLKKDDSQAAFFEACCTHEESSNLTEKLLNLITAHNKGIRKSNIVYRHCEEVFGLTIGACLVYSNLKYCETYGNFIATLDMNHEVNESSVIYFAFEKYGCNLFTMSLLSTRLFLASGQHSHEDLTALLERFEINNFLEDEIIFDVVFKDMMSTFLSLNHDCDFYSDYYIDENDIFENNKNAAMYALLNKLNTTYQSTLN